MSAAHTSGPWSVGDVDWQVEGFTYQDVHAGEYGNQSYRSVAHVQAAWDGEHAEEMTAEDFANARLIAAAPELLEALATFLAEADAGHVTFEADRAARAAIAKARGEVA